ncbi:MAG: PQQ-dependent sugar dehydrogenase [Chloroflexi bacterium]|nr:PQQ-dependent sugar dehydrogenase [Chloroflexota bacterium]
MAKRIAFLAVLLLVVTVARAQPAAYQVELLHPIPLITSIVWSPDGRMFFTEKSGGVRVVAPDGTLQQTPVVQLNVRQDNEDGLHSIALDPDFPENHYFYVYYTPMPEANGEAFNLITRFTEQDGVGVNPVELFRYRNESPLHQHHGGRLVFGPDGYLYFSIGDLSHWNVRAQDPNQIEGKIHRVLVDGDKLLRPDDNPFPDSTAWAYGLRNVFSFTFDPYSGGLFATENGPDCDDFLLRVEPGDNFGWGMVEMSGDDKTYCNNPDRRAGATPPLMSFTPTVALAGIDVYDGEVFPDWQGDLLACEYKSSQLVRFVLDAERTGLAGEGIVVDTSPAMGCAVEVAVGPDGLIYYTNLMGMYRIAPVDGE